MALELGRHGHLRCEVNLLQRVGPVEDPSDVLPFFNGGVAIFVLETNPNGFVRPPWHDRVVDVSGYKEET